MQDGERSKMPLSRVQLGYVPWLRLALTSPLSPEEINHRIAERIDHRVKSAHALKFTGSTWTGQFEVSVRTTFNSAFRAAVYGSVERSSSGSRLHVELAPNNRGIGTLVVCVAVSILLALEGLNIRDAHLALFALIMGVCSCSLFTWSFRRDGPRLLAFLEEQCAATLPSSASTPTTF